MTKTCRILDTVKNPDSRTVDFGRGLLQKPNPSLKFVRSRAAQRRSPFPKGFALQQRVGLSHLLISIRTIIGHLLTPPLDGTRFTQRQHSENLLSRRYRCRYHARVTSTSCTKHKENPAFEQDFRELNAMAKTQHTKKYVSNLGL